MFEDPSKDNPEDEDAKDAGSEDKTGDDPMGAGGPPKPKPDDETSAEDFVKPTPSPGVK